MIPLQHIKAVPLAGGNRIGLQWLNPWPEEYGGVKIVCKELTHPTAHHDGRTVVPGDIAGEIIPNKYLFSLDISFSHYLDNAMVSPRLAGEFSTHHCGISPGAAVSVMTPGLKWKITDGEDIYLAVTIGGRLEVYGLASVEDTGLQAETVYYYTLFPCNEGADDHVYHFKNRASAMATGKYGFDTLLYNLLPSIYHRYDNLLASGNDDNKGPLRRFLELPGEQLDQSYSFVRASADLHHLDRVDGRLLPLLSHWIGWETDYNKEIEKQRIELRNANALYRAIGSIPTLETMIKQVSDWENRVKEFMHNVFVSNRPEQLYPRICHRNEDGPGIRWLEDEDILSVDFAHDGRPSALWVTGETDVLWMFYHTPRKGSWNTWLKTYTKKDGWSPSRPFTTPGSGTMDKYPSAALQGGRLWVFRCSYDPQTFAPSIRYRVQTDGKWSEDNIFDHGGAGGTRRKNPFAVVDDLQRLWLFWLEESSVPGTPWQLKYNRHNGTGWESLVSIEFPMDGEHYPGVEDDLFVLVHPLQPGESQNCLTLLWTRKDRLENGGNGHMRHLSRKEVAFRHKTGDGDITEGWGPVFPLPKAGAAGIYDDCEPAAAIYKPTGDIHLCWSTNRGGNWSVRHIVAPGLFELSGDVFSAMVIDAGPVIDNLYSQRTPLPLFLDRQENRVSLVYRSSRGPTSPTATHSHMAALDFRSAGSTSVDDRTPYRLGKQNSYIDFLNYTYDTGRSGQSGEKRQLTANTRYTHDTVGLFLTPTLEDLHLINRNQELIKGILGRFVPILTRVVFIIVLPPFPDEIIYDYDSPIKKTIGEEFADTLHETFPNENYPVDITDQSDIYAAHWRWFDSWSDKYPDHQTVDTGTTPVNTDYRSVHTGLIEQVDKNMLVRSTERYPGVSEDMADTFEGFNETKSWVLGSTEFSYSVDFGGGPLKDTLRSWNSDFEQVRIRVEPLTEIYPGVSDDMTDTFEGFNETKSWALGSTDFSSSIDFSGGPLKDTLRSWNRDFI